MIPDLRPKVKSFLQTAAIILQGRVGTHMRNRDGQPRNTTATLRIVSGRLFKSFQRGASENIFDISGNTLRYGTETFYGEIHERGKTIRHPGSTKLQRFTVGGAVVFTRKTRAHNIGIPARPFLSPALQDFQREDLPEMLRDLIEEIATEFNS